jgi:hypothetical protein
MKILDSQSDKVISGITSIGYVTYQYALDNLAPLIDKVEFQRKLQDKKFYKKLERDLEDGCVIPPITIAFIDKSINQRSTLTNIQKFIKDNIDKSFVLDGIQRLNTLSRLKASESMNREKKLYINFIFCDSEDKLLYRMITLNNGQRPMTPRHQVEVMMSNVFDFKGYGIQLQTEKERAKKKQLGSFNKSDLIQAYLAFMADSPLVDNKKIIQDKMDELLVSKIISNDPLEYKSEFKDVLKAISTFQKDPVVHKWLRLANNLIGFSVGMKLSKDTILKCSIDKFRESIENFDQAFSDFNPSKIKVGKLRRELSCEYFRNYDKLRELDSDELLEHFSELTHDN